ncbi:MAG: hypothetical protein ABSC08_09230 [Bryobacteraceae bacterium]
MFVLASLGAALGAAPPQPPPVLETNLLVFPNKAKGAGQPPSASDFRATVGKVEYEVRSVIPAAGSPDLKTVVVFDLASVPPDYQPCFIQQARAVAPALRRMNNVTLFVVSWEWTRFHKPFGYGPREMYEYFLPEPKPTNEDECVPLKSPLPQLNSGWTRGWRERERADPRFLLYAYGDPAYSELATIRSFRGIAEFFQTQRGPVRVLWIGQRFGWVHPKYYTLPTSPDDTNVLAGWDPVSPEEPGPTPDAAFLWLDAFTRAGISFWPVVWLGGESEQAQGPKSALKEASEIAQRLGGQANLCQADLADCLEGPLVTSGRGWIVRVAGPKVGWPDSWAARCLHLWYQPDPGVLDFRRAFVRLAKKPQVPPPTIRASAWPTRDVLIWHSVAPRVPLFDSVWLNSEAGCDTGTAGGAKKYAMTALVPDAVVRGLQAYVEVLSVGPGTPEKQLSKRQERAFVLGDDLQLHTRPAPQLLRETGQGSAEICVELPSKRRTHGSYRIVLFNPTAGWAGVGVLPTADVVEYLQRH